MCVCLCVSVLKTRKLSYAKSPDIKKLNSRAKTVCVFAKTHFSIDIATGINLTFAPFVKWREDSVCCMLTSEWSTQFSCKTHCLENS